MHEYHSMPYPEYIHDVAFARSIHKKYGKSFYFGTLFLSEKERNATCVLYAFFRFPDEYVDTYYANQKDIAIEKLNRWNTMWQTYWNGSDIDASLDELRILRAAKYVFKTYNIPYEYSQAFIGAMIQDTTKDRYETYEELTEYMYGSAVVVGLMMTYVMCARDSRFTTDESYREQLLSKARSLGEAFQMTNFLRDVGEDVRDRGRIYLPKEDMRTFGVSEEMIVHELVTQEFVALMQFEIERTEKLYVDADEGIALLPHRASRAIIIARKLYSAIIPKIVANRYDVFHFRAHVSFFGKLKLAMVSIIKNI